MDLSLDELIEKKMSAAGVELGSGGRKGDTSGVAGENSKTFSKGSAGVRVGPTRCSAVKRSYGLNPESKLTMDMSLDELIEKKTSAAGVGLGGGGRQGVARGNFNSFSNGSAGVGGGPMRWSAVKRPRGFNPYYKGGASYRWTRDTYEGLKNQQTRGGLSTSNSYKIIVSNLGTGVTSADIQELFHGFGSLKAAAFHYDKSGKPLGTACLEFGSKISAINAVSQYNNVTLDGLPMKINFTTSDLSTVSNLGTRLSRPTPMPVRDTHGGGIWSNCGNTRGVLDTNRANASERGGRGRWNSKKTMLTKDLLDKQLESIIKKQKQSYNMNKYVNCLLLNLEYASTSNN